VDIKRLLRLQLLAAQRAGYVSLLMHRMMLLQHVFTMKLLVANFTGKLALSCCAYKHCVTHSLQTILKTTHDAILHFGLYLIPELCPVSSILKEHVSEGGFVSVPRQKDTQVGPQQGT
jgi:hypothetical protein